MLFSETLAPSTTDNSKISEDFYVDTTNWNHWGPAVFTASVFVSYFDVFGELEEVEFFFLLYNGNEAAWRIMFNAKDALNSVNHIPMGIPDVSWRTEGKKRRKESHARLREWGHLW